MRTLTWAARSIAAVSGAVLAGALVVPSATAFAGPDPKPAAKPAPAKPAPAAPSSTTDTDAARECQTSRDVSSAVVDYSSSGLFETVFRTATDRQGHAFLNDSRNPGVWVNLGLVAGAPSCIYDTSVAVTEEDPGHLFITLLDRTGTLYQARCNTSSTAPFTPSNTPTACAPGFSALPDTPV
ncbi:hypothetical protein ACIPRL_10620 [Streptomyces sp. NPDC090085]|uniref:hypothetical protein n=1 Tax=unclassified Streptomyces TaxID=2593676 RepID=UPI00342459F5